MKKNLKTDETTNVMLCVNYTSTKKKKKKLVEGVLKGVRGTWEKDPRLSTMMLSFPWQYNVVCKLISHSKCMH